MFNVLFSLIPKSVKDASQRVSSSRIQSYFLLVLIYIFCFFFIGVEIIRLIKVGVNEFNISDTIEQIFWALLAHHIVFAGVNKNSKSEPSGDKSTTPDGEESTSEETKTILKD